SPITTTINGKQMILQPQPLKGAKQQQSYDEINEFNLRINRLRFIDDSSASSTALTSPAESMQHIYLASTNASYATRDLRPHALFAKPLSQQQQQRLMKHREGSVSSQ